ncbi:hypothetical protein MVEN_00686000 [Mycena venus]|uniref:Uncharacterized protein n=1 Tax=Mycena venus TaxID=2733690 RepID=A0A8H7D519_9AGAR|nr:hypothetical protein MVEN_00686000 [Mycena venus]
MLSRSPPFLSIERWERPTEPYVATRDLGAFPARMYLTLSGVGTPLQRALERSWMSTLQTISCRLLWVGWEGSLRQLDAMRAGVMGKMPALRRVKVAIVVSEMGRAANRGVRRSGEKRSERGCRGSLDGGIFDIKVVTEEEKRFKRSAISYSAPQQAGADLSRRVYTWVEFLSTFRDFLPGIGPVTVGA